MRGITAKLMTKVCHNVGVKPTLQPLSGKLLQQKISNHEDDVRLDIVADKFPGDRRHALRCESVSSEELHEVSKEFRLKLVSSVCGHG